MTRILYWNVRDFGENKINNIDNVNIETGTSITKAVASNSRRQHMRWLINTVQPDIFVMVEVERSPNNPGHLAAGAGYNGSVALRNEIAAATGQLDWSLVPPLDTGPNEAVSVFYRHTQRYFTGPYLWPGGGGPSGAAVPPPRTDGLRKRGPIQLSISHYSRCRPAQPPPE